VAKLSPYLALVALVAMAVVSAVALRDEQPPRWLRRASTLLLIAALLALLAVDRGLGRDIHQVWGYLVHWRLPEPAPTLRVAVVILGIFAWLDAQLRWLVVASLLGVALVVVVAFAELRLQEVPTAQGRELSVHALHLLAPAVGTALMASSVLAAAAVSRRERPWRGAVVCALWAPCITGAALIVVGSRLEHYGAIDSQSYVSPDNYLEHILLARQARWLVAAVALLAALWCVSRRPQVHQGFAFAVGLLGLLAFAATRTRAQDAASPILPAWSTRLGTAPSLLEAPPEEPCYRAEMQGYPAIVTVHGDEVALIEPGKPPRALPLETVVSALEASQPRVAHPLLVAFHRETPTARQQEVLAALQENRTHGLGLLKRRSFPPHPTSTMGTISRIYPCVVPVGRALEDTVLGHRFGRRLAPVRPAGS
jgi:hypothetical protein